MTVPRSAEQAAGAQETLTRTRVLLLGPCALDPGARGWGTGDGSGPELTSSQRKVLARLALDRPRPVGTDELVWAVWGNEPPATATAALQNQISRVRRHLGADSIATGAAGYTLMLPTDLESLDHLLERASSALHVGDTTGARAAAQQAIDAWRGTPLEELGDLPEAVRERRRLVEMHRSLENLRLRAAIADGSDWWAVPEAERLVADTPHDERRWVMLLQALDLAGRRGDALGAFGRARRALAEELGLSPGSDLLAAEAAVLGVTHVGANGDPGNLVGREALVDTTLSKVSGHGVAVLAGEPGVGKTRILDETAGRLRRDGHTVARCEVSWHPASAIETLTDLAEELGVGLDPALPPTAAFCSAIADLALPERPLVLCVDDIDRAGPSSIAALIAAVDLSDVALLSTATELGGLPPVLSEAVVAVPELDPSQVADLVACLTEVDSPDPSLVAWLLDMSGGNPMLVEYLIENPVGSTHGFRGNSDDPVRSAELRDLIRARTQRLGADSLAALETAAVCGPRSRRDLVAELSPRAGIEEAIAASLLVPSVDESGLPWLAFRHGAVRRTIYDDLPPGRRTEIHHRAAEVLESLGESEGAIATHAVAAAGFDPAAAARRATAAALAAEVVGAYAEAATWYEQAAAAAERAQSSGVVDGRRTRVAALVGRGDALRRAGSPDQKAALFAAAEAAFALGDAGMIGDAAFAVLQLGTTTESGSLHVDAIDLADRSLAVVTDADQRAMISAAASLTHSMTGAPDRCRQLFIEAERLATSSTARRQVLPFAYLGLGHPSDLSMRERLTDELIELGTTADDAVAMCEGHQLSFSIGLMRSDGPRVRAALAEQTQLVERVGDVGRRWSLEYQRAAVAHLDGDLTAAEHHAEVALALFGEVSPSRAFAVYGAQMLPVRIAQGRLGELLETLETLVADQPGVPAWHAALALALAPTEPARAHEHALAALDDVAHDFTWLAAHIIGGRAAAVVGDARLCDAYEARLAQWSGLGCWQGTCSYGPVDTVLARLAAATGRHDDAARLAASALEQSERLGACLFVEELGELLDRPARSGRPARPGGSTGGGGPAE